MPPPPPPLPDELVEEVLVRVRPDDPASLVRAALACRRWRNLVADPAFRRRRLDLHGAATPPMLGFVCDGWDRDGSPFARFIPTSSFRPSRAEHRGLQAHDARHGRVLLHGRAYRDFTVWDPIADTLVELPSPPDHLGNRSTKATVLCAATDGSCDHLDCHRGPFIVVLVGTNDDFVDVEVDLENDYIEDEHLIDEDDRDDEHLFIDEDIRYSFRIVPRDMFACVYSSESVVWGEPTFAEHPADDMCWTRSALVGNALYFRLRRSEKLLRYDLGTRGISLVRLPIPDAHKDVIGPVRIELTTMEDGRLGFLRVEGSNELCLWSRDEDNKDEEWTFSKVISVKQLSSPDDRMHVPQGLFDWLCRK